MNKIRYTLISALALFSLFFGAGNLILPPQLGFLAGASWWLVAVGFAISAVLMPILAIVAHSRLQGTMYDFGKKVSPAFSVFYCYTVYAIALALPSPRTASVTHEMAVGPLFNSAPLLTSIVYFLLVFLFVIRRGVILDVIGKFLTPAILIILAVIIGSSFWAMPFELNDLQFKNPITAGILEGYQTFDALGGVVIGGVIIISINDQLRRQEKAYRACWLAGRPGAICNLLLPDLHRCIVRRRIRNGNQPYRIAERHQPGQTRQLR